MILVLSVKKQSRCSFLVVEPQFLGTLQVGHTGQAPVPSRACVAGGGTETEEVRDVEFR